MKRAAILKAAAAGMLLAAGARKSEAYCETALQREGPTKYLCTGTVGFINYYNTNSNNGMQAVWVSQENGADTAYAYDSAARRLGTEEGEDGTNYTIFGPTYTNWEPNEGYYGPPRPDPNAVPNSGAIDPVKRELTKREVIISDCLGANSVGPNSIDYVNGQFVLSIKSDVGPMRTNLIYDEKGKVSFQQGGKPPGEISEPTPVQVAIAAAFTGCVAATAPKM